MKRGVGRLSRAIDLVSLLLLVAGAGLYLRAFAGMKAISVSPDIPFVRGTMEAFALTNQYLRLQRLSYIGLVMVGVGVTVGLSAAVHARKIAVREAAQNPQPE